jgi:hypothetical protein
MGHAVDGDRVKPFSLDALGWGRQVRQCQRLVGFTFDRGWSIRNKSASERDGG